MYAFKYIFKYSKGQGHFLFKAQLQVPHTAMGKCLLPRGRRIKGRTHGQNIKHHWPVQSKLANIGMCIAASQTEASSDKRA